MHGPVVTPVFAVFVCAIQRVNNPDALGIASSAAGNNEGFVLTFGIITAIAAVILIVVSAVTNRERIDVFEDAIAEKLEAQIDDLVAGGADETKLRALIRDALRAGSKS